MRLLLDTNVLVRAIAEELGAGTIDMLADPQNDLYASDVSLWELAIKTGLGKLQTPPDLEAQLDLLRILPLPLQRSHIAAYRDLPLLHRDPFDRMLVAQARAESLILVTSDRQLADYDVTVLPA